MIRFCWLLSYLPVFRVQNYKFSWIELKSSHQVADEFLISKKIKHVFYKRKENISTLDIIIFYIENKIYHDHNLLYKNKKLYYITAYFSFIM